jgi:hypothetical protein
VQNKSVFVAFRRWAKFRRIQRRIRAYKRRDLLYRFKEWRALVGNRFRVRLAAVEIQRIARGYVTRKNLQTFLERRRYQLDVVQKVPPNGCESTLSRRVLIPLVYVPCAVHSSHRKHASVCSVFRVDIARRQDETGEKLDGRAHRQTAVRIFPQVRSL